MHKHHNISHAVVPRTFVSISKVIGQQTRARLTACRHLPARDGGLGCVPHALLGGLPAARCGAGLGAKEEQHPCSAGAGAAKETRGPRTWSSALDSAPGRLYSASPRLSFCRSSGACFLLRRRLGASRLGGCAFGAPVNAGLWRVAAQPACLRQDSSAGVPSCPGARAIPSRRQARKAGRRGHCALATRRGRRGWALEHDDLGAARRAFIRHLVFRTGAQTSAGLGKAVLISSNLPTKTPAERGAAAWQGTWLTVRRSACPDCGALRLWEHDVPSVCRPLPRSLRLHRRLAHSNVAFKFPNRMHGLAQSRSLELRQCNVRGRLRAQRGDSCQEVTMVGRGLLRDYDLERKSMSQPRFVAGGRLHPS